MSLRVKHTKFIESYTLKGSKSYLNASESAVEAGYSSKSKAGIGHLLIKRPEIKAEIDRILDDRNKALLAKSDIGRDELVALTREALDNVPDTHSNKPRYIELIGKLKSMFSDSPVNNILVYNPQGTDTEAVDVESDDSESSVNRHNPVNKPTLKTRLDNLIRRKATKQKPNSDAPNA